MSGMSKLPRLIYKCAYVYTTLQDVSLIHDIPNTENIVTRERTELLMIDKEVCCRLTPMEGRKDLKEKLHHIRSVQLRARTTSLVLIMLLEEELVVYLMFCKIVIFTTSSCFCAILFLDYQYSMKRFIV